MKMKICYKISVRTCLFHGTLSNESTISEHDLFSKTLASLSKITKVAESVSSTTLTFMRYLKESKQNITQT